MPAKRTSGDPIVRRPNTPGAAAEIVIDTGRTMDGKPVYQLVATLAEQDDETDGNAELLVKGWKRHDELLAIVKGLALLPSLNDASRPAATTAFNSLRTLAAKFAAAD